MRDCCHFISFQTVPSLLVFQFLFLSLSLYTCMHTHMLTYMHTHTDTHINFQSSLFASWVWWQSENWCHHIVLHMDVYNCTAYEFAHSLYNCIKCLWGKWRFGFLLKFLRERKWSVKYNPVCQTIFQKMFWDIFSPSHKDSKTIMKLP